MADIAKDLSEEEPHQNGHPITHDIARMDRISIGVRREPVLIACAYCSMEFETTNGNQKFCSKECRREGVYEPNDGMIPTE
jgi:hypothetical protein